MREDESSNHIPSEDGTDKRQTILIMKLFMVLVCVAVAAAAPQRQLTSRAAPAGQEVEILRYDNDNDGLGSYRFAYELSDQSKREEQGELKNAGSDDEFVAVKGSYSWVGPDGILYTVTYEADENGFRPNIEQPPGGGVPSAVIASLVG